MATDGSIRIDTKISQDGINKGIKDMQKNLNGAASKLKGTGKKMSAAVTAPIVGLGTVAFMAADQVDQAYGTIQTSTGATGEALDELKQSFDEVFTEVPDSADQVASALSNLNTYTNATGDVLEGLTENVMDASRSLGEDGVANSEAFGKAMAQWQIPAEEGQGALDKLFVATQEYGIGLGEVSSHLTEYGSVLNNAGFSMEESADLFARLENNGISVSRVMPGLNAGFRKWAAEGKNSQEELQNVIDAMRNAENETEALAIAQEEFGAEGAQRLQTAIRNDALPSLDDLGGAFKDAEGAVEENNEATETFGEKMGTLRNILTDSLAPLGDILISLAENAIPPLMEGIQRIAEWFRNLSPAIQNTIVILGGVLAAIGPLLVVVGSLISAFSTILPVIKLVGAALSVLVSWPALIIAAIAGLVALVVIYWEEIKEVTITVFTAIGEFLVASWEWIKETAVVVWTAIAEFFVGFWEGVQEVFTAVVTAIRDWLSDKWTEIQEKATTIFTAIGEFFSSIWNWIKNSVVDIAYALAFEIQQIWRTIRDTTSSIWNGIKDTLGGIWDGLKSSVSSAFNWIKDTISGVWDSVKSSTDDIWTGITDSVKGAVNGVIGAINGMIDALNGLSINLPTIPDWVPGLGGSGGGEISFPNIPKIPSLDVGTNFVASDGLAYLHQGEAVVPKEYNPAAGGGGGKVNMTVIAQLDGEEMARVTKPYIDTAMGDDITIEAFLRGNR